MQALTHAIALVGGMKGQRFMSPLNWRHAQTVFEEARVILPRLHKADVRLKLIYAFSWTDWNSISRKMSFMPDDEL